MSVVFPNESLEAWWHNHLQAWVVAGYVKVHLWRSLYAPIMSTTLAFLNSIESSFGGYSPHTLTYDPVPIFGYDSDGRYYTQFASFFFTANGFAPHETVYGYYYVVDDTVHTPWLLAAEIIDPPAPMLVVGDNINLTLQLKDWSESHPI